MLEGRKRRDRRSEREIGIGGGGSVREEDEAGGEGAGECGRSARGEMRGKGSEAREVKGGGSEAGRSEERRKGRKWKRVREGEGGATYRRGGEPRRG